jgi:hypothetical protein
MPEFCGRARSARRRGAGTASLARHSQGAKGQVETIAVWSFISIGSWFRLGRLLRSGYVEILARWCHRAPVFSLPDRKIHPVKLLPFERDTLQLALYRVEV